MKVADLIAPTAVFAGVRAGDKRQLLQMLAERAAPLSGVDFRAHP